MLVTARRFCFAAGLLVSPHPDFHALRSMRACREARLVAFDLLTFDGQDLRQRPLEIRRRRLAALIESVSDFLWLSSGVTGDEGRALFRHACNMNLEGIVSKRAGTPYRSGHFDGWLKIKCPDYVRV